MINNYIINMQDYNQELASTCRRGISFDPERFGANQYKQELNFLNVFKDELFLYIKNINEIPFYTETMDYFISKYLKEINISNQKQSRCVSSMIAWPANFKPTTKANNSYEKQTEIILALPDKTKAYFLKHLKKLRTENAGWEKAQKQAQKIELEKTLELYKFINKTCRSTKTTIQEKINIIKEYHTINEAVEKEIVEMLEKDYKTIFAWYQLTSINSKIKRLRDFITKQDTIQAKIKKDGTSTKEVATYRTWKVIQDLETQRINILFEEKPEQETINNLKQYGFKWSYKFNVWTRKLTNNAVYTLKLMLQNT